VFSLCLGNDLNFRMTIGKRDIFVKKTTYAQFPQPAVTLLVHSQWPETERLCKQTFT